MLRRSMQLAPSGAQWREQRLILMLRMRICAPLADSGDFSWAPLVRTVGYVHPMFVTMMKAKLHRATVTQADLEYEGSIAIDRDLLDASGILAHEQVDVLNITTGARFTTYAIEAPRGSKVVGVNGAAARLVQAGDKVIVVTYCQMDAAEARNYAPVVVLLDDANAIKKAA
jgi:aspartate 1-decarboxylase